MDDVDVIPYLYKYVIHTDVKLGEEAQITEVGVHIADVTHFLRPGTVGRPERILFLEALLVVPQMEVSIVMRVSQHGWFIMENPTKMDDFGVSQFSDTHIFSISHPKVAKTG